MQHIRRLILLGFIWAHGNTWAAINSDSTQPAILSTVQGASHTGSHNHKNSDKDKDDTRKRLNKRIQALLGIGTIALVAKHLRRSYNVLFSKDMIKGIVARSMLSSGAERPSDDQSQGDSDSPTGPSHKGGMQPAIRSQVRTSATDLTGVVLFHQLYDGTEETTMGQTITQTRVQEAVQSMVHPSVQASIARLTQLTQDSYLEELETALGDEEQVLEFADRDPFSSRGYDQLKEQMNRIRTLIHIKKENEKKREEDAKKREKRLRDGRLIIDDLLKLARRHNGQNNVSAMLNSFTEAQRLYDDYYQENKVHDSTIVSNIQTIKAAIRSRSDAWPTARQAIEARLSSSDHVDLRCLTSLIQQTDDYNMLMPQNEEVKELAARLRTMRQELERKNFETIKQAFLKGHTPDLGAISDVVKYGANPISSQALSVMLVNYYGHTEGISRPEQVQNSTLPSLVKQAQIAATPEAAKEVLDTITWVNSILGNTVYTTIYSLPELMAERSKLFKLLTSKAS